MCAYLLLIRVLPPPFRIPRVVLESVNFHASVFKRYATWPWPPEGGLGRELAARWDIFLSHKDLAHWGNNVRQPA